MKNFILIFLTFVLCIISAQSQAQLFSDRLNAAQTTDTVKGVNTYYTPAYAIENYAGIVAFTWTRDNISSLNKDSVVLQGAMKNVSALYTHISGESTTTEQNYILSQTPPIWKYYRLGVIVSSTADTVLLSNLRAVYKPTD